MTVGHIYTIAGNGRPGFSGHGGPAVKAMAEPAGIAVNGRGALLIADQLPGRVRLVTGGP
jgi:serine/threonine protein kinase, bacterial